MPSEKSIFRVRRRRRRQRFATLVAVLAVVAGGLYLLGYASGGAFGGEETPPAEEPASAPREEANPAPGESTPGESTPGEPAPGDADPEPEPALKPPDTPEGAAYLALAPELPGVSPESIKAVYRSTMNPAWASVHVMPANEKKVFVVFVKRNGDVWEAEKSMRADEPDYPKNDLVTLGDVPRDLLDYIYPENLFAAEAPEPRKETVDRDELPDAGPAESPPLDPVTEGVPDSERESVEKALERVRQEIEDYGGVAGVYVQDLEGGWGYGMRPDEEFFSASVIKIPVMVAVYRKIDEGELALSDSFETQEGDWAAGAGWLQWDPAGKSHTVEDYLYMMMAHSDNVATNALIRKVGGADHVNEVARSLGAENTVLYQKVSSERAAVPRLDNRTTPRDMATMMAKIAAGEAASPLSCKDMIHLMYQNELDWWLDAGLPADVWAANKAGWLYEVYDEAGIVEDGDRPYAVSILSKYGPEDPDAGRVLIEELSRAVWEAQQSDTEQEKQDAPEEDASEEDASEEGDGS